MNTQQSNPAPAVDIAGLIDASKLNFRSLMIVLLSGLCLIVDGFDVQSMGYVAPSIIQAWHIDKSLLGPVFGAALFGMLFGSLVLSIVADRIGRRPVLIGGMLFFAVFMLITPLANSVDHLLIIRFLAGLALGCIMPNAMSLVGEYSPARSRVMRMMLVSCGFTAGAAVGGFLSAFMIPRWGWESVFIVGGIVPLVLAVLMLAWLPESIQFLVLKRGAGKPGGRAADQARRSLSHIEPGFPASSTAELLVAEKNEKAGSVAALFREGRTPVTLLLWGISLMNLVNLYFLSNWLPTLLHDSGYGTQTAVLIGTSLQVGGTIGTILLGRIIERYGFVRVLAVCFVLAFISVAAIGHAAGNLGLMLLVVVVAGFCIVGGQPAINALGGVYYPTSLRSTGIGWILGIGRIGSIIGPVVAGVLIGLNWSNAALFHAAAVPVLLSFVMVLALRAFRTGK